MILNFIIYCLLFLVAYFCIINSNNVNDKTCFLKKVSIISKIIGCALIFLVLHYTKVSDLMKLAIIPYMVSSVLKMMIDTGFSKNQLKEIFNLHG